MDTHVGSSFYRGFLKREDHKYYNISGDTGLSTERTHQLTYDTLTITTEDSHLVFCDTKSETVKNLIREVSLSRRHITPKNPPDTSPGKPLLDFGGHYRSYLNDIYTHTVKP